MSFDPTKAQGTIGRRSKLSMELIDEITTLIEAGNYVETACAAVGISQSVYYQWLRRGKEVVEDYGTVIDEWPDGINDYDKYCAVLLAGALRAQARSESYAVATIRKAMNEDWRAAMTWLERRHPGRWAKHTNLNVNGEGLEPGTKDTTQIDNPEAVALMHEALDIAASRGLPAGGVVDAEVVDEEGQDSTT